MGLGKEPAEIAEVSEPIRGNYIVILPRPFGEPQNRHVGEFHPAANDVLNGAIGGRSARPDEKQPAIDGDSAGRDIAVRLTLRGRLPPIHPQSRQE